MLLTFLVGYGEVKSVLKGGKLGANLVSKIKTAITKFKKLPKIDKEKLIERLKKTKKYLSLKKTVSPSHKPNPNLKPKGKPKKAKVKDESGKIRSVHAENESAEVLSKNGYNVEQLPEKKVNGQKNPDFKIEGEIFDCYAPDKKTNLRRIWSTIEKKVSDKQAKRFVLNLDDCDIPLSEIKNNFKEYKIETLIEILATKNGQVIKIYP